MSYPCVRCDCGGFGRRETDTMDTFVDSSWYYLRYLDPNNDSQLISPAAASLTPVDLYIGGKEHGLLHFLFSLFKHYTCMLHVSFAFDTTNMASVLNSQCQGHIGFDPVHIPVLLKILKDFCKLSKLSKL